MTLICSNVWFLLLSTSIIICLSVVAASEHPLALNVVLIGFHKPERGWVSDYDLERALVGTVLSRAASLGQAVAARFQALVKHHSPNISSQTMANELESLRASLGLDRDGFTLFVLNLQPQLNANTSSYGYCQSPEEDSTFDLFGKSEEQTPEDDVRSLVERGETWAGNRVNAAFKTSACKAADTCRVNAWITNSRVAWIDLTATRMPWGNKYGLSIPKPPTYSLTLQLQHERAMQIKRIALTEKHCKECKTFLQAWASLLDRAAQETDFSRAYDTVARASDALESIIAQEFAVTMLHDPNDDVEENVAAVKAATPPSGSIPSLASSSNSDFLAHLSLVIRSFVNRVFLPFNADAIHTASLYGFEDDESGVDEPTSRVSVHLYLVRGHDDDADLGPNEDDLARMKEELGKLAAPGFQSFSLVIHRLDLDHDPILASAFAFSLHSMVVPTIVDGRQMGQTRHYINAKEFRQVLLSENDRVHLANSSMSGKVRSAHHTELPVFWFYGVDSFHEPLFVDGFHRAVHLQDLVVVVESKHASVERLDAWCGGTKVKVSIARPLRAALLATAQLWWTENLGAEAAEAYINEGTFDWSWAVGVGDARGLSLFEERDEDLGGVLLSTVFVDAFHRSTILEFLRRVKRITDKAKKLSKQWNNEVENISRIQTAVIHCSQRNDWNCAFEKLVNGAKASNKLAHNMQQKGRLHSKSTSRCSGSRQSKSPYMSSNWEWFVSSWWN